MLKLLASFVGKCWDCSATREGSWCRQQGTVNFMVNSPMLCVFEADQPSLLSPKQCYEHRQTCCLSNPRQFLAAVTLGHNTFFLDEFYNNDPRWSISRNHEQVCWESADNCDRTIAAREVLLCPENFLPCLFLFTTKANTKSRYPSGLQGNKKSRIGSTLRCKV